MSGNSHPAGRVPRPGGGGRPAEHHAADACGPATPTTPPSPRLDAFETDFRTQLFPVMLHGLGDSLADKCGLGEACAEPLCGEALRHCSEKLWQCSEEELQEERRQLASDETPYTLA